jgi:anti-sigma regulatory factor (Ser/Thr protein kinase)
VTAQRDLRVELRSEPRLLGGVRCLVGTWMRSLDIPAEVVDSAVLAVDEACSNAIRHAYCWQCEETVVVSLRSDEEYLEIEVRDQGEPCPEEHRRRKDPEPPKLDELEPGGLGLRLIHEVFDEVRFTAGEECGNSLTMRLRRPR